jgi:hypothetical protein
MLQGLGRPNSIDTSPTLSVAVVVVAGQASLLRCLEALARQPGAPPFEIVVAHDEGLGSAAEVAARFPQAILMGLPGRRTYAELRACAVRSARGDVIALTEDHCAPQPDWCAQVLQAHAAPHPAIGGAVEKGPDTALNWAIYLCDYGRYMNPVREGPTGLLTDCNVTYKRAALAAIESIWRDEFHEPQVHAAMQARGGKLWLSPKIVVRQQRSLGWRAALRERLAFGQLFAATRPAARGLARRAVFAGLALALPPIIIARIGLNVLGRRRHLVEFARALPALLVVTCAWAVGEFAGYVTGRPPASLAAAK